MIERKPPRLANWLLSRLGHQPMVGDIIEEFREGRSVGWYWRQTFAAIRVAVQSAKPAFAPLLIGWLAQLLIVEALVAWQVHFGFYGSLLLVTGYVALSWGLISISVELELRDWWDTLFKSFLSSMFSSGWIAFIDAVASLLPFRYRVTPSGVEGYFWINLLGLFVSAWRVVKSNRRHSQGGAA